MAEETKPNPNPEEAQTSNASQDAAPKKPAEKKPVADKAAVKDKPAEKKPVADKPAAKGAKAKKAKPPAVESKPFNEFIEQDYVPALKTAFAKQGINDINVTFVKEKIQITGMSPTDDCWQVKGNWNNGQRQFSVYFPDQDIKKRKAFSYSANGVKPSTIESFMIDERRVTLDLMVFYTIQRLNAQKWLAWN